MNEEIYAKIIASNYYGDSPISDSGNGGLIELVPDAPVSLLNNPNVTNASVIGLSWLPGSSDGGS